MTDDQRWQLWRDRRPTAKNVHFDTAAAGRSSVDTLRATAGHAEREAAEGAYVAQAAVGQVIDRGRADIAAMLGAEADGIAFVESASVALGSLLNVWPLSAGDTVAVVRSEWGPTLGAFTGRGLNIVELETHPDGTVDVAALRGFVSRTPPAFVHLTMVASHRPLVQPVAEAAAVCQAAGVPLWVDAAQAVGHVDAASGADVSYATSRKWLTGPRGVGMLAIARQWWDKLRIDAAALDRVGVELPVRLLESREAHVAGRVGLCTAVREQTPDIRDRLAAVGELTRSVLSGLPGWEVLPAAGSSAITALRPLAGQDVPAVRAKLLADHQIVTTAAHPARAPREMTGYLLRVSPHVDCQVAELERLRAALA